MNKNNQLIIALKSLLFAVTLLSTHSIIASQKITPLTDTERTDLNYSGAFVKYPSITILEEQPEGIRYGTCHNYTISKILGLKGKIPETFSIVGELDWYSVLKFTKKYCREVSTPQKGDLTTYHESPLTKKALHTGSVYADGIIESKWGTHIQVLTHPTLHVPALYGNHVKYYRIIKTKNEIITGLKESISQYNYAPRITHSNNQLVKYAETSDNPKLWKVFQGQMCVTIEASNVHGQSLLMIGAKTNNSDLVQIAIQHKANITKKDTNGKTALKLAEENGHSLMVALLKQHISTNHITVK